MEINMFTYDEPRPYLTRLFKLDLNGDDDPLSGTLLSMTNDNSALMNLDFRAFLKTYFLSISEYAEEVMDDLGDGKGYDALSYCWGQSKQTFPLALSLVKPKLSENATPITVPDPDRQGTLHLQENLHEILLQMRRQLYNRFIWIDAICIDQSSALDKENQIPSMRVIYENAETVHVWLGRATALEEGALKIMTNLTELFSAIEDESHLNPLDPKTFESVGLPLPSHDLWASFGSIFTRPWWSRLWTLQEVVVAKDDLVSKGLSLDEDNRVCASTDTDCKAPNAIISCGNSTVRWETLEKFALTASRLRLEDWIVSRSWGVIVDYRHAFDAIREVRTCRESYRRFGWSVSLSALLLATRSRRATVPADFVIGQSALLDRHTVKKLGLNSSQPAEQVFVVFGKHYIRQEAKECLLNHIITQGERLDLPSWCPNFASPPATVCLGSRWLGHYESPKEHKAQMYHAGFEKKGKWRLPRSRLYYANYIANSLVWRHSLDDQYATDNPRQVQLVPNSNNILLSGIDISEVVEVVPFNPATENAKFLSFNSIQQTADWEAACFALARRAISEGSEGFDIYARTLTANRVVMYPNNATERIFDPNSEVDFVGPYLGLKRFMQATLDAGESIAEEGNIDADVLRYVRVLERITRRRTFFATKDGRIGIGPSNVNIGDRLVVVFYTPTPYLLRRNEGNATLAMVGETYVHGLMYGEALEMFDNRKAQESKWIIA